METIVLAITGMMILFTMLLLGLAVSLVVWLQKVDRRKTG